MRPWGALLAALLVPACVVSKVPVPAPCAGSSAGGEGSTFAPLLVPMSGLAEQLAEHGFRPGPSELRGFLPNGARRVERVSLPAHSCVAWVAVASAAMIDLDAGMYAPDGQALTEDANTDARPILSLCTGGHARELYYTLHAYQGGGAFLARSFVRAQRAGDRDFPLEGDSLQTTWAAVASRLQARGFDSDGVPLVLEIAAGEALRVAVSAEVGHCYAFVAEAAPELQGAELKLTDLRGRVLAHAVIDGGPTGLQYCAARTESLVLLLEARAGRGGLRLSRFRGLESRIGGRGALWMGEPQH